MKKSLKDRILKYVRSQYPFYVHGGVIEKLAGQANYKSSNASRRCREMESGSLSNGKTCDIVLEKKEDEKGRVMYRALPPKQTIEYTKEGGDKFLIYKW